MTGAGTSGKAFLVTGACGGLGSAVAGALATGGAVVFASDSDARSLQKLSEKGPVRPLAMDVTDPASVRAARGQLQGSAACLDGIVFAAGIYVGGPLLDIDARQVRRALDVNVMGAVLVTREFVPLLREGGRLVFVSSESTRAAMPFTGPYVMSKKALEAYADTLRRELLPLRIGVIVIQPGAIRTPLLSSAAASLGTGSARPVYRDALRKGRAVLEREMRTGMEPGRVARVIVHALECRRPRLLYRVGNDLPRALLSRLPAAWIDALVRRFL